MDTGGRKWGTPYLTRSFFDILGSTMADKVVLVMAEADGRPVGGALNLKGDDTLYGRYWGCLESHAFLHFEACYYQAIDYAIAHGLARVEAGAQGDHKIQRGYLPVKTYSAHWIVDKGFRRAVDDYLEARTPRGRAGDRGPDAVLAVQERERGQADQRLSSYRHQHARKKITRNDRVLGEVDAREHQALPTDVIDDESATQKTAVASTAALRAIQIGRSALLSQHRLLAGRRQRRAARAAGR